MTVCPFAVYRPVANHGGRMGAHLGLVLHVQAGNGGLSGWFSNPAAQASSTWWVSKTGTLEQYVDSDLCAWAQGVGNGEYNSVETEGWPTEPFTAAQEAMLARLYQWGVTVYHWPLQLAELPGQPGFGWHGMGGLAWGGHTGCPGDLRKNRRQAILDQAGTQPAPTPPSPPPSGEETEMFMAYATSDSKDGTVKKNWQFVVRDTNITSVATPDDSKNLTAKLGNLVALSGDQLAALKHA